jgi:hypothetical protein
VDSVGLTKTQKGDLGEKTVLTALKLLKVERNLFSDNPVRIGDPYKLITDNHRNPDLYAPGYKNDYLFEVKNDYYKMYSVPGAPYPAFYRQSRTWVYQNIINKNWNAKTYSIRKQTGEHHSGKNKITVKNWKQQAPQQLTKSTLEQENGAAQPDTETAPLSTEQHDLKNIQNAHSWVDEIPENASSGVVRVLVCTYPSFTEAAEIDLLQFFGSANIVYVEHPITPPPDYEQCEKAASMRLVLRLEELLKFHEDYL